MAGDDTRILAVVGDPVAHSLSPRMQNAAIGAAGIDAVYIPLRTTATAFGGLVKALLEAGGACNVTAPFKDAAYTLEGEHSELARRTRAVNCVWGEATRPRLDNTDVAGVRWALVELLDAVVVRSARLFGTGGAARAAAVALADEYPGILVRVVSRSPERAGQFAAWAAQAGVSCEVAPSAAAVESEEILVNATPCAGMLPARPEDECNDPEREPGRPRAVLDLNYRGVDQAAAAFWASQGVAFADGRHVLIGQGAQAFERFFGVPAPVGVMRAAVEYALGA